MKNPKNPCLTSGQRGTYMENQKKPINSIKFFGKNTKTPHIYDVRHTNKLMTMNVLPA